MRINHVIETDQWRAFPHIRSAMCRVLRPRAASQLNRDSVVLCCCCSSQCSTVSGTHHIVADWIHRRVDNIAVCGKSTAMAAIKLRQRDMVTTWTAELSSYVAFWVNIAAVRTCSASWIRQLMMCLVASKVIGWERRDVHIVRERGSWRSQ